MYQYITLDNQQCKRFDAVKAHVS